MFEEWETHGLVGAYWPQTSVLSHALLFDLVFCYAGQAGKSRKHGATSQAGHGKSRKHWATPTWSLPRWARLVKAGRAGGPPVVGTLLGSPRGRHIPALGREWPPSKQAQLSCQRASWSRPNILSNALHAACPAQSCPAVHCCISEHSAHSHTDTQTHYIDRTYKNYV